MPESLRHRSSEFVPAHDEEDENEVSEELEVSTNYHGAVVSRREPLNAEQLQVFNPARQGGSSSQHERQSNQSGGRFWRDDRFEAAGGQDPQSLPLGIARRFEVTQNLANDGIDSMYMEDVTRLGRLKAAISTHLSESWSIYLAHDLFASFFPPELDDLQQPKVVPMTWQAVHFEHTFIAAAWLGSASRLLMTGSTSPLSQRELRIHHSAIQLLRRAVLDPVLQTHDSTIQAILHLTFKPPLPSSEPLPPSPRQSVFHTWNVVNVTSGLNITEEHLKGVRAVVSAKGGIQNIKTDQIRHLVSL
jgi:hypothetical protein